MKYLVTGSSGFIGSHLIMKMTELGYDVDGIDIQPGKYTNIQMDFFHFTEWYNYDIIYHLASLTDARASFTHHDDYYNNIVEGILFIIGSLKTSRNFKELIFTSSMAIYCDTPYGKYKKQAEDFLEKSGLNVKTYRLANVWGPGSNSVLDKGKNVKIFGNGHQVRDYVYIDDVIDILLKKTYEVGTGVGTCLNALFPDAEHIDPVEGDVKEPKINTDCKIPVRINDKIRRTK